MLVYHRTDQESRDMPTAAAASSTRSAIRGTGSVRRRIGDPTGAPKGSEPGRAGARGPLLAWVTGHAGSAEAAEAVIRSRLGISSV
jgi:hypothetical protein